MDGQHIEDRESFVYLGVKVRTSGDNEEGVTEEDINARLGKARTAYSKLDKICKNSQFTSRTKIKIFKSDVISVLLYGCETWRMTQTGEKKLDVLLHKSLSSVRCLKADLSFPRLLCGPVSLDPTLTKCIMT